MRMILRVEPLRAARARLGVRGFRRHQHYLLGARQPKLDAPGKDPIGPDNDLILKKCILWGRQVIAAIGAHHGRFLGRGPEVAGSSSCAAIRPVYHLGLSKDGHRSILCNIRYSSGADVWKSFAGRTPLNFNWRP